MAAELDRAAGRRLRVGFVLTGLVGGGAERSMLSIIETLDRSRFAPLLVLFTAQYDYEAPADVPVIVLPGRGITAAGRLAARIGELTRVARRERLELLVSFLMGPNIVAIAAGRRGRIPVIAGERSAPSRVLGRTNRALKARWLWTALVRRYYPRAAAILTNTSGAKRELAECYGVTPERVRVLANPLDLAMIRELAAAAPPSDMPAGVPVLVSVGRFSHAKDHPTMLRAFARVRGSRPSKLVLVGSGENERQVRALARQLGIDRDVVFTGFTRNPYAYLSRATISLLTSTFEGLPNAILESMALGIPVVSTACAYGPVELLRDGDAGVLVPVGDAEAIADAIHRLLDDPAARQRLSARGLERAAEFDRARLAPEYGRLFDEIARSGVRSTLAPST